MPPPATGKVLLIAGGSTSVGSAIARAAQAEGWTLAIHDRIEDKLAALMAGLMAGLMRRGPAEAFLVDIGQPDAADTLVAEVTEQFGRLDAVIDCAALSVAGITGQFTQADPSDFEQSLDLSVGWLQRLAHTAYPHLARDGGTLISFVPQADPFAASSQALIGAARAGAIGFIRNFAVESARDGVRAHCISASFAEKSESSKEVGFGRMVAGSPRAGLGLPTAEDIAPLAMFLCGDGARKITGQVISVNGGLNA